MSQDFGKELKKLRIKAGFESQAKLADATGIDNSTIARLERGETKPTPETLKKLSVQLYTPYQILMALAGHLPESSPEENATIATISKALAEDSELTAFWDELLRRDDLQIMLKQVKDLSPEAIRRIIKYIKMVEEEEAQES